MFSKSQSVLCSTIHHRPNCGSRFVRSPHDEAWAAMVRTSERHTVKNGEFKDRKLRTTPEGYGRNRRKSVSK
jgi:hypothetical protein